MADLVAPPDQLDLAVRQPNRIIEEVAREGVGGDEAMPIEGGRQHGAAIVVEILRVVAAATEETAEQIASAADKLGYETEIDFDDGEDAEEDEEITEPWTCTCRREMLLQYDAVIAAQKQLDDIARPLGGYSDGWGTFGNAQKE